MLNQMEAAPPVNWDALLSPSSYVALENQGLTTIKVNFEGAKKSKIVNSNQH